MQINVGLCCFPSDSLVERMPVVTKMQLQKGLSQISDCNIFFKTLGLIFGWAAYLPLSDRAAENINSSRLIAKLCASTFSIPKMMNHGISLHGVVKEFVCCERISRACPNSCAEISKSVSALFFSSIEMLNKTARVISCLDKTKIIDLSVLGEGVPGHLEKVCCAANVLAASHRFISAANQFYLVSCSVKELPEDLRQEEEGQKRKLMLKMASNAFKIFTSVVACMSLLFPVVVTPVLALGLSTASFLFTLGSALYRFRQNEEASLRSMRVQPIYYLNA